MKGFLIIGERGLKGGSDIGMSCVHQKFVDAVKFGTIGVIEFGIQELVVQCRCIFPTIVKFTIKRWVFN